MTIILVELGKLSEKMDGFSARFDTIDKKLEKIYKWVDRLKTGLMVAIPLISVFGTLMWWILGDKINKLRDDIMNPPAGSSSSFPHHPESR